MKKVTLWVGVEDEEVESIVGAAKKTLPTWEVKVEEQKEEK